jgi:hypothetical protein
MELNYLLSWHRFFAFLPNPDFMSDDNNKKPGADRTRVAFGQDWETSYMTRKFKVSVQDVDEAVKAVGNSRAEVEQYLREKEERDSRQA